MKGITKSILILVIISLSLLSACGSGQSADVPPNADHLVAFNEAGLAVLRGTFGGGAWQPATQGRYHETVSLSLPVKVDGVYATLAIPIIIQYETEIASSQIPKTTVREHLIFHPDSSVYKAFNNTRLAPVVEVTFRKNGSVFEAVSIREVQQTFGIFVIRPTIRNLLPLDVLSQGTIETHVPQASISPNGEMWWMAEIPIDVHGIASKIFLRVEATSETRVGTPNGSVALTTDFRAHYVLVEYTRRWGKLTARQITNIP